jgi:hypothetical protein
MPDDAAFAKDVIKENNNSVARIVAILLVIMYH